MTTAGKDNLTRAEAQQRKQVITGPAAYDVSLDLRRGELTFDCDTTVTFEATPGASTFIDFDAVELLEAELNGKPYEAVLSDGRVELTGLEASNVLRIRATCEYSRTGTGLHRFVDPVDKEAYVYTQFEPFDAHRVFPCFDQPDIKATFRFDVDVPEEWVVISNTRPVSIGGATQRPPYDLPKKGGVWSFEPTPVMSTYLGAICAGPYQGVFDQHRNIALSWWCRKSLFQYVDAEELFAITKAGFDFFEQQFDYPYMLDSYDQVFCPEYKFGAMENLGCVTYTERFIFRSKVTEAERERRAEVILHEMSHMWFGDLVTMKWWNDLWLNESFATYMAYLAKERATRFTNSFVTFLSDEKVWAYRQDQLPTTHPIVADIPDVEATHLNFDGITYAKGASVLKQLVAWVGEDGFFKGLRRYFKTHAYKNTELPDFLAPLAEESGRDLTSWAKEWLETSGVNSIRCEAGDGTIVVTQDGSPLRSHRMAVGLFDAGATLDLRRAAELDVVGARTEVTELAGEAPADLVLPNHRDLAYCKIRFDERSLQTLTDRLRDMRDPLARSLCWVAAWDMVRDGELAARRYIDLVLNNATGEDDIGVLQDLVARAGAAAGTYGAPDNRENANAKIAAVARAQMEAAPPGSDLQLTWARAFIGSATTASDLAFVRLILDGDEKIDGLEIDTDMRWHIVGALAEAGVIDDAVIAAELERDPTDQGERYAAGARASRPTAEAKAQAWAEITENPEITLAMIRSLMGGFHRPGQDAVLAPYADRYFDELMDFWGKRELDLGIAFTGGMFPRTYDQATIDRAQTLLDRNDLPVPVRRLLLEAKDDAARVMRARAADAD